MSRDITILLQMLQYRRPDKSQTEANFIDRYIKPVAPNMDKYGNFYVAIGDDPTILWSSHTDTVHRGEGFQTPFYDCKDECIKLSPKGPQSTCLGADCGAGIFIMLEMIKAKVPGLYIFHRNEETGGGGSRFIAKEGTLLKGIRAAIAFDRRGKTSVITHQGGNRTCSDAFANSIIAQIEGYKIDTGGSFTDTASYKAIVPECSNLSVGYEGAHFSGESLHVPTLLKLRDAMLTFDATQLVIERDPTKPDPFLYQNHGYVGRGYAGTSGWAGYKGAANDFLDHDVRGDVAAAKNGRKHRSTFEPRGDRTLLNLVLQRAWAITKLFESWGMDYDDIIEFLEATEIDERTRWEKKFHEKHQKDIEKVFAQQLERQRDDGDDDPIEVQGVLDPEPVTPQRRLHHLTEEQWQALQAEENPQPRDLFEPPADQEPIKLLPGPKKVDA